MSAQLDGPRSELATVLADLIRNGVPAALVQSQLAAISQLQQQINVADASTLAAMPAAVAGMVADVLATAQQGGAAVSGAEAAEGADIASLAATSRATVNRTMQGMKDFDLTFASAEDEAAYRRREAERLALIEAEQKKGTPEGDLNAAGAAVGQMADAAAHGAAADPRFQQRWEALMDSTEKLRAQIIREGGDVSKFDARLREDLRQIMKSKGKTDAEIDALLAAHPDNPMDAMKAFVAEQKGALTERDGTVRISVCGRAVDHQAAMALMKRSPKITANCAFAMVHSRGGIFHSFSDRFKIR
ncbi:hypothetical protein EWH12_14305 [Sphingobium cupriresistens]|uniref:Uncharacterized protein n=1 Tax=Sphingobium cupriresistens TaxID=1132417 RepID=A0A8G2DV51_9SPHN|nr:hypothetical protein EWH12_14305 [Sphingobium cupriresistens]